MNTTAKGGIRVPTGQRQINEDTMKSIGFTTDTKVEDRAVTRQGLQGIVPKKEKKMERKIQDKSYFMTLLKTKIGDISKEIFNMNNEIGTINTDLTTYANLNKTFETLSKEVQNLEGELADYNLAGDKYRSMMKAEDIQEVYTRIQMYNRKKMDESDNLYLENAHLKEQLEKVEAENDKVLQEIDQRLLELEPDQRNEYEQIKEDNEIYIKKFYALREEMSKLNMQLIEGEELLKNNPNKREAQKLKDEINQLLRKKEELELQTNEAGLSMDELKQRLVAKAKEDTIEKGAIDKKISDNKKIIDTIKKSIAEIEKEMKNSAKNDNTKTVDTITKKDKEYSAFIENYSTIKKTHYKEIEAKEEVVLALLKNISQKIKNGESLIEGNTVMKEKIKEKKEMIEKSVSTLEEAKAKYEELLVKLQRFENLDETLKKDIDSYKMKLDHIHKEINTKFDRIDDQKVFLKNDAERMKNLLIVLKENKDNYNKMLTKLVLKSRTKNSQLEDNPTYKKLRELEKKMQANENNIYSLNSYIDSKGGECQFAGLLKECMKLQESINAELLKKY
ncbi:MAG: hypothetical protein MJ252_27100 [archaeon]|nr:hypothetical protein [archaeon]